MRSAKIAAFKGLPFRFRLGILRLVNRGRIATLANLSFTNANSARFRTAVLGGPSKERFILAMSAPSIRTLSVGSDSVAIHVGQRIRTIHFEHFRELKVERHDDDEDYDFLHDIQFLYATATENRRASSGTADREVVCFLRGLGGWVVDVHL